MADVGAGSWWLVVGGCKTCRLVSRYVMQRTHVGGREEGGGKREVHACYGCGGCGGSARQTYTLLLGGGRHAGWRWGLSPHPPCACVRVDNATERRVEWVECERRVSDGVVRNAGVGGVRSASAQGKRPKGQRERNTQWRRHAMAKCASSGDVGGYGRREGS